MTILTTLIMLALLATVVSLVWGIGSIGSWAHGGRFDAKHSTQLMSARVILQGLVIVLILIAFYIS